MLVVVDMMQVMDKVEMDGRITKRVAFIGYAILELLWCLRTTALASVLRTTACTAQHSLLYGAAEYILSAAKRTVRVDSRTKDSNGLVSPAPINRIRPVSKTPNFAAIYMNLNPSKLIASTRRVTLARGHINRKCRFVYVFWPADRNA